MKPEAQVFEITSLTKKISLNYHLNKFFQFNYFRLEVYSKVESEPKHEVVTIERAFKFRKKMAFSVLDSLRTVLLHSTLAVNN